MVFYTSQVVIVGFLNHQQYHRAAKFLAAPKKRGIPRKQANWFVLCKGSFLIDQLLVMFN